MAGNKISETETGAQGNLREKKLFSHDSKGNVTKEKNYDSKDSLNVWYNRKYDALNNLTEEVRYIRDKEQWKVTYTFNTANKKESETHIYPFEKSNNSIVWRYDDQQRLIEVIIYDFKKRPMQKHPWLT